MLVPVLTIGSVVLCVSAGTWAFLAMRRAPRGEQLYYSLLAAVSSLLSYIALLRIAGSPLFAWNALRLVGPVGLAKGQVVYPPFETGPALSGNAPLSMIAYVPTALAPTPFWAVIVGALLSVLFCLVPSYLWLASESKPEDRRSAALRLGVFLTFCLLALKSRALNLSFFIVHADAPSLGLAAGACALVYRRKHLEKPWALVAAATLAFFSFWSKITFLPLLVAIPLAILLWDGPRAFARYVGASVAAGAVVILLSCWYFGMAQMADLFSFPLKAHWVGSLTNPTAPYAVGLVARLKVMLGALDELLQEYYPHLVVLGAFAIHRLRQRGRESWLATVRENRWLMVPFIACFMLPASLAGRVKLGGALNTQSPFVFFLVMTVTLVLADIFTRRPERLKSPAPWRPPAGLVATLATLAAVALPAVYGLATSVSWLEDVPLSKAYRVARARNDIFFPEFPLVHLFVDGRIYHSASGIMEYLDQGFAVDRARYLANIPPSPRLIAWGNAPYTRIARLLPEYRERVEIPGLEGFVVYARSEERP